MFRLFSILIGYALGNFLTAEWVVRRRTGKSVFDIGSGNPGMANVMAQCGFGPGMLVLAGDLGKTVLACVLARFVLFPEAGAMAAAWAGLGAVLGHNFPCWHRFRGGKGVACTCAAIFCVQPLWGLLAMIVGMFAVFRTQYLPVGAVLIPSAFTLFGYLYFRGVAAMDASGALPAGGYAPPGGSVGSEIAMVSGLLSIIMLIRHFPGLRGAAAGTEPKINVTGLLNQKFGRFTVAIAAAVSVILFLWGLAPWYQGYMRREDRETCWKARFAVCLDYQAAREQSRAQGKEETERMALLAVQNSLQEHFGASMSAFGEPVSGICRSGDGTWTILYDPDTKTITISCTAQDHEPIESYRD